MDTSITTVLLPNNPEVFQLSGIIDRRQGRWPDAVRNLERASELDPRNVFRLSNLATTYWLMREYEQLSSAFTRMLALNPNDINARLDRAFMEADWRADIGPWHREIEKILADDPAQAETEIMKQARFFLALWERDVAGADRAAATLSDRNPAGGDLGLSRDFWTGLVGRMKGDLAAARAAFTTARVEQEKQVRAQPDNGPVLAGLGVIDAALGRKEEALREGRRAIELTPVAKDSLNGATVLSSFAQICAWTGEGEVAIEQLQALAKIPGGPSYGDLRLSPVWDPLRGDPRFEKIIAESAKPIKLN
jgi:tetratricopeptide (TPR) repeat protein